MKVPLGNVLEPADDEGGGHVEGQVADDVDRGRPLVPLLAAHGLREHGAHVEAQHVPQVNVHAVAARVRQHLQKHTGQIHCW